MSGEEETAKEWIDSIRREGAAARAWIGDVEEPWRSMVAQARADIAAKIKAIEFVESLGDLK